MEPARNSNPGKEEERKQPTVKLVNPKGYVTNPPPVDRQINRHSRLLEVVKNIIPDTYLIVGVTEDVDTEQAKGLTVMSGAERSEVVRACKWVDEVIQDCPPVLLPDFFEEYKIDYFAHEDDYRMPPGREDPYAFVKRDGRFLVVPRTDGISTTSILTRVLRDRERYIARQIRSGVSREEMNLP